MLSPQSTRSDGPHSYDESVRMFVRSVRGHVVRPQDDSYNDARTIHNAAHDRYPQLIVQAADAADVISAVNFARDHDLTLAVRSGGHSVPGHGTSDDMVLDLSAMKAISIDPERRIIRAEAGLTWAEFAGAAQAHGLAVSSGDTGTVGLGGLTTGGGIGWMVRKYGLTIDHLLSVDVVTADGRLVHADASQNADLFWAVRGGGGNFGIAIAFEFQAHPVGMIVGGAIFYDAAEGERVLREYARYAAQAPDELTTIAFIMHAPPLPFIPPEKHGTLSIVIGVAYTGDLDEGQRVVAPLRSLGAPIADVTSPMPYPALFALTEEAGVKGHHSALRSMFLHEVNDDLIGAVLKHARSMSSPFGVMQLRVLGGAMARIPADATAFVHRDKPFMLTAVNVWMDPGESERHRAWTENVWRDMRPYADGVYANFLGDEGEDRVLEAYGQEHYRRLADLKSRYDPTNVFRLNQNIKPAAQQEGRAA